MGPKGIKGMAIDKSGVGESSITAMLGGLKAGDAESARQLWEWYFENLVRLARSRLRDACRAVADEEDVALDTVESFLRGARDGRFPSLNDSEDLWRILVAITGRKAMKLKQYEHRLKRGAGRVISEVVLDAQAAESGGILSEVPCRGPSPELAAILVEEYHRRFQALPDVSLRLICLMRLEGYTDQEIASNLDCSVSTVERGLRTIRSIWADGQSRKKTDDGTGP
jgi:DNA-directed RNA polymerase specialized sigma24 family protein